LPAAQKKIVAQRLSRYTGIPAETWESHDLILEPDEFAKDVLGNKTEFVGHYDTRDVGKTHPGEPYNVAADPSLNYGVDGVITDYLQDELGFKSDAFYAGPFGGRWPSATTFRGDWASVRWGRESGSRDRGEALVTALEKTPGLRVLVGSGYFDLSTPYASSDYTFSHLGLSPELRRQVEFKVYPGGHAAYMDPAVRVRFAQDVQDFVSQGSSAGAK
jgi:carboxypeptidase C (cathepsin A)